jgi:adenosylcobinamide amidohydrolase
MTSDLLSVRVDRPWLTVALPATWRALSFAPYRPGDVACDRVLWREVRDQDLTQDFDAVGWLAGEVGSRDAVAMLTSRNVDRFVHRRAVVDGVVAEAVATVGLSNAERIGTRRGLPDGSYGTINVVVAVSEGLTPTARIEALSIAASARTAAVMEAGIPVEAGVATGTGTDCLVVTSPVGKSGFAGMHTGIGEAVGACVFAAVAQGVSDWLAER